ncbi:hypothetical protein JTB14_037552 [Gonioctena quinquepunctata]|nr:hypothetical protein JTB14_037552 [Gonioctena quinquepunctata]
MAQPLRGDAINWQCSSRRVEVCQAKCRPTFWSVNDPHTYPEPRGDQQLPTTQSNEPANEPILIVDSDESDDELAPNAEEQPVNEGDEVVVIEDVLDDPRYYNIVVPFRERSCQRCLRAGRNLVFMALNEQMNHAKGVHPASEIVFECTNCERLFPKKHSAVCHVPKCTGGRARPARGHECGICGESYDTQCGLSQHERLRHPVARNEARAAGTLRVQPPAVRIPRHNQVFTEEEIRIMLECEVRYQGDGRIVKHRMGPLIRTKTLKQLRDERAETRYKERRDEYVAAHLGAAGPPIDPLDQPACERAVSPPIFTNDAAARIEMDEVIQQRDTPPWNKEWRTEVVTSALAQQLPQNARRPPEIINSLELLAGALRKVPQEEQSVDQTDIDNLYQMVLDCIGREGRPKPPKRRKVRGRGTVARHVRNNVDWVSTGEVRCSDADVRELYQNLWGNPLEVQYPFLEIKERISQINQSTAAGLDGFLQVT